jgi:hypothetical protein
MKNDVKIHFLCVGFQKCGTTSLFNALNDNKYVYLPLQKETFFCKNMNCETEKQLRYIYSKKFTEGKLIGGIEPTYYNCANEVFDYFGSNVKLIFCIDNPVNATISAFKMYMRDGSEETVQYYEKYGTDFEKIFDAWFPKYCEQYHYTKWIDKYLQVFDKKQIYFVLSNELYKNPNEQMRLIQKHIGLMDDQIREYNIFPHYNKDKGVSKNLESALVNRSVFLLWLNEKNPELREKIDKVRNSIFEVTTVNIPQETYMNIQTKLKSTFSNDVKYIENVIGKSLQGEWY